MLVLIILASTVIVTVVPVTWIIRDMSRLFGWPQHPIIPALYFNLKPFFLPALMIGTGYDFARGNMSPVDYILTAISFVFGIMIYNDKDDDDRWKRRREKLASKVQEAGGKLVIVPVGSNA